jgi:stage V sporulation protein SpoVS
MAENQELINNVEKELERKPDPAELRVASKTKVNKLAGSIIAKFNEFGYAKLRCIGDGAIGVGFRGATIAINRMSLADVSACITGAFFVVELENGEQRNGSIINVEPR